MAQFGDFTVDRNSTKYVLGSGGTIISYATDEPAFEFNADGSYKGLLVETAATNICLQSEDLNTPWFTFQSTVTANDTTAPDGNATADKLGDNNSGGVGDVIMYQTIIVSANTKYTASVFLKADQLSFASLEANGYDGTTSGNQFFGLSGAGTKGTASNLDDSKIEEYPNGWYRCSITWTQGAADTSFQFRIYVADSISNRSVDRDTTSSIFAWGAQVETGPIATSYIPTTTASVTRVKDRITQTSASSLIGQTEGTLYIEVDWRDANSAFQFLLSANNGSNNHRLLIYETSGNELRMYVQATSVIVDQGQVASGYSGIQKIAFAYADSDFELYRNGSSISSSTSGSLTALATLTIIYLGQNFVANNQANMWIRAVALYKTRLTNDQLADLTS